MKTTLLMTMVVLASGCGGEAECSVDMESTVERAEPEACPDAASEEVLSLAQVLPTYSSLVTLKAMSRELTAPALFSSMTSDPAATVCWYEPVSRFPQQCAGDVRPGDGKVVSRDAYRKFGLGGAGTVSACGASDGSTFLSGKVTTSDDPSSVRCAATETNAPLVGRDDLPARRECTYRWRRQYHCVYDRGLGGVGGLGSPGGP
jgi:hypothetical protein